MKTFLTLLFLQSLLMPMSNVDYRVCESLYCLNEARYFLNMSEMNDLPYLKSLNVKNTEYIELEDEDYAYRAILFDYRNGKSEIKIYKISKDEYVVANKNK